MAPKVTKSKATAKSSGRRNATFKQSTKAEMAEDDSKAITVVEDTESTAAISNDPFVQRRNAIARRSKNPIDTEGFVINSNFDIMSIGSDYVPVLEVVIDGPLDGPSGFFSHDGEDPAAFMARVQKELEDRYGKGNDIAKIVGHRFPESTRRRLDKIRDLQKSTHDIYYGFVNAEGTIIKTPFPQFTDETGTEPSKTVLGTYIQDIKDKKARDRERRKLEKQNPCRT